MSDSGDPRYQRLRGYVVEHLRDEYPACWTFVPYGERDVAVSHDPAACAPGCIAAHAGHTTTRVLRLRYRTVPLRSGGPSARVVLREPSTAIDGGLVCVWEPALDEVKDE